MDRHVQFTEMRSVAPFRVRCGKIEAGDDARGRR